jgi:NADH:ubiquinone oxidoreductase subunit 3 (subunit A)
MADATTVTDAYLAVGLMTLIGILVPFGAFLTSYFVRPRNDPSRPHMTRSYLLEGYEADHSLYPRRLSTYECGSEPVGDAMIQFHFQYYWYALIFLVFDVAFMFMALGGFIVNDATALGANGDAVAVAVDRLLVLTGFFLVMTLGVWHVFRKRGRIYI